MFGHILVPTDGSPPSGRAARLAIRLAKGSRARLTALHVVTPFKPLYPVDYMAGAAAYPELYSPAAYNRITRAQGERILAKVARAASAAKVKCDMAIVYADPEWKAILSATGDQAGLRRFLILTIGGGLVFLCLQSYEWTELLLHKGQSVSKNNFGATFFILTGFHGCHVFGGVTYLAALLGRAVRGVAGRV